MTHEVDVAVVGAGVTGLELTRQLRQRGLSARCVERADEPGGVVRSLHVDGRVLDLGPQRLRATPQITEFVDELGLDQEVVDGDPDLPIAVLRDGELRRVPLTPRGFATTDLLSLPGKLRFLAEPVTAGPRSDDTVASFLARSFGREAYRGFLGPLYGGIYGSDPSEMPLRFSLGRLLEERGVGRSVLLWAARRWLAGADVPAPLTFDGGLQRLPEAMYAAVEDAVSLGVEARSVRRRDGGFTVTTSSVDVHADHVVVATAADAAATLLRDLDRDHAEALGDLRYNPLAVVHVDAATDGDWMGYQVAFGEDLATRGVTWNDALFGRDGVHTCFLGGATAPEVVERDDEAIAALATDEFEAATGVAAESLHVHRTRMPAFDGSWTTLEEASSPDGVTVAGNYTGRAGIPGRLRQARRIAERLAPE